MTNSTITEMKKVLDLQKQLHIQEGPPSVQLRKDRLDRCVSMVKKYQNPIILALQEDFGNRDPVMSVATEVLSAIGPLEHAKKNLSRWMKPEKRRAEIAPLGPLLSLMGARARIEYQPMGTVGCISPWNFPVNLVLAPMGGILAAGNRVMVKPSEITPSTSAVMKSMFEEYFDQVEIAVFTGDAEVGAAFSSLPFDHMLFTGGTAIAKHVMKAASENLVPITLELGGKSPVIIGKDSDVGRAAIRVMQGKTMNAGQICLAPDYALVPKEKVSEFVEKSVNAVSAMYPSLKDNDDYTSIINEKHFDRIQDYLKDAKDKGAEIIEINPSEEDFSQQPHYKIPPTLVLNPTEDMKLMQEEIFGPVLPIKSYEKIEDTVDYINTKNRPLGLYYFGDNKKEQDYVLKHTTSGGVTVNDVISHITQENLPFGGVGPSGMGSYHGYDGFKEFSHAKSIYKQTKINLNKLAGLVPPYKSKSEKPSASS
ncbi:MAG: coniferyl aldehyde dehydrogenase [SAR86 cluster bacterium]|jgi:coniferyl-aldehyde dehydrogenase|nr:coniferyl aldehyde dehydrogenase [SAR86 cluster bacterium]